MGITSERGAINVVTEFPHSPERECGIVLYTAGRETMRIPFSEEYCIGSLYSVRIEGNLPQEFTYMFYIDDTCFCDPYARSIKGRKKWGDASRKAGEVLAEYKEQPPFDWEGDRHPRIPYEDSVIYGLHVRGFTRHVSSGISGKGTFEGIIEKIPYLKELGITAIECMPFYEFDEILFNPAYVSEMDNRDGSHSMEAVPGMQPADFMKNTGAWKYRINYWGFSDSGNYYFAPKGSYAASKDAVTSCKNMIKALHKNGIECIMQIYFPPECSPGFIQEVLRFWVLEYHIDGFHLLGMKLPMELLGSDPVLKKTKLYCENPMTDQVYEAGGRQPLFRHLACYREDFSGDFRRFLKGDEDMLSRISEHVRGNSPWEGRINYITDYKGFTLMDLVSYDRKHNEENGEDNRDGSNYNFSWNCGVEGPSRKAAIQKLRLSQRKNAFAFLMLSQGTPFILAGDEFGHSTGGNNNAYCHDNKTNWLNWKFDKNGQELFEFTKKLIAFRREHPILHTSKMLRMMDYESCGYPDISFHGEQAWYAKFENYNRHLGIMYCGLYEKRADDRPDDFLYIAYNMHWITHEFALPILPQDYVWEQEFGSREFLTPETERKQIPPLQKEEERGKVEEKMVAVPPRSVLVLVGKKTAGKYKKNNKK